MATLLGCIAKAPGLTLALSRGCVAHASVVPMAKTAQDLQIECTILDRARAGVRRSEPPDAIYGVRRLVLGIRECGREHEVPAADAA